MNLSFKNSSETAPKNLISKKTGQVLVEYLLLLVIAAGCASLLVKQLVNRSPAKPGLIINAWNRVLGGIGQDIPDCAKPNCQN